MNTNHSACFVTPSYARDFNRCRLLVESRRACAPEIDHYLIVDKPDLALFRQLADNRTIIVPSREILDAELHKLWGNNSLWIGRRVLPLRGWITQQLRKMAMPRITNADVLINIDSDVVFVRPFSVGRMFDGDRLALFETDYRNAEIEHWARDSASVIGVPIPERPNNYVGMLIGWWSKTVRSLTAAIEEASGLPWQIALGRRRSFSEYMLYGTYVRCGAGLDAHSHFSDQRMLVRTSWGKPMAKSGELANLFSALQEETVAVMVHSKDGIDPAEYERLARQQWA